jgi:hypothetical protein
MKKKLLEQQKRENAIIESFTKVYNKIKRLEEQPLNESTPANQLLKKAHNALLSGSEVTVMGKQIGKIVIPAGAFMPTDGSPMIRISNIENPLQDILIDGQTIDVIIPEPKPMNPITPPSDSIYTDPTSKFYRGTD